MQPFALRHAISVVVGASVSEMASQGQQFPLHLEGLVSMIRLPDSPTATYYL